jgi:predicted RNA-binding protein with PUA-like domain
MREKTPVTTTGQPRTWLFQANPNKYRIEESLKTESEEEWNLNQHAESVHTGDRVLIWISGAAAGIYAIGEVVAEPRLRPDSPTGLGYWHDRREGEKVKPRVRVRYVQVFLDRPLHKVLLEFDPILTKMGIMRFARGTNFSVTDEEWAAIQRWLVDNPED